MAAWFLIKILSMRSLFGFNAEKKYDEKNACVQRGNSNWGNFIKYQNIKLSK